MKLLPGVALALLVLLASVATSCASSRQDQSQLADNTTDNPENNPAPNSPAPNSPAPNSPALNSPAPACEILENRTSGARQPLPDSSPREDVPSALADPFDNFEVALIDPEGINSGGPQPDGIPTLDSPCYLRASEVDFLDGREAVLTVNIDGDARAYPLQILTRHELVNDTVGGVPVTISYCPLCNSGVAYDRRVAGRLLDFGTSGKLYQSSLVMYDRQTQSLWTHFDGQAVLGHLAATRLDFYPAITVSWELWSQANPDGLVLNRQNPYYSPESYGGNPYVGYDTNPTLLSPSFQSEPIDPRLAEKERVVGIRTPDGDAVAIVHSQLQEQGVAEFTLAGENLVAWNLPGTSSAIDSFDIAEGRDVGTSAVFSAETPGGSSTKLSFERTEGGFVDSQTGSFWSVLGEALSGPLAGTQLEAREHLDTFWFAWATFADGTEILEF